MGYRKKGKWHIKDKEGETERHFEFTMPVGLTLTKMCVFVQEY